MPSIVCLQPCHGANLLFRDDSFRKRFSASTPTRCFSPCSGNIDGSRSFTYITYLMWFSLGETDAEGHDGQFSERKNRYDLHEVHHPEPECGLDHDNEHETAIEQHC